ncbi:cytochrome P450 [Oceanobacter mangrovi]|uniref:cytochrome P450 n=1 Tax=Oceanobacter mangrovi TaxID=2862510 RepID=UPI001C8E3F02|nr:cytochrome P450 [Oceanobacter mangrovi]
MTSIQLPRLKFAAAQEIDWLALSASELIRFRQNNRPVELLEQPFHQLQFGERTLVFIADPAAAHEILVTHTDDFPKAVVQQRLGSQAFGPGISGTLGARNERQRIALKALVSAKQAQQVGEVAKAATQDAIQRWLATGEIDLYREMSELALQITWDSLFGNNQYQGRDPVVTRTIDELHQADKSDFVTSANIVARLTQHFHDSGRWQLLPQDNPLRAIADEQGWPTAPGLSQAEVKANALVFAASGHVTTGLTMAWCGWLLGLHPDIQQDLAERLLADPDDDQHRRALRNVVNETLRLFPPGTDVMRDAKRAITIQGQEFPAGSMLLVSLYFLHRHHKLWDQPDQFNPQRFAPDASPIAKGSFMPFSGGNYGCSGMSVAWSEIMAVMTECLRSVQFDVSPASASQQRLEPGVCLYPTSALRCRVTKRTA